MTDKTPAEQLAARLDRHAQAIYNDLAQSDLWSDLILARDVLKAHRAPSPEPVAASREGVSLTDDALDELILCARYAGEIGLAHFETVSRREEFARKLSAILASVQAGVPDCVAVVENLSDPSWRVQINDRDITWCSSMDEARDVAERIDEALAAPKPPLEGGQ